MKRWTIIHSPAPTPTSNSGRQASAALRLIASAQQLIQSGQTTLDATTIAHAAGASVVTVRAHWQVIAEALDLRPRSVEIQSPSQRVYRRAVLIAAAQIAPLSTDQADDHDSITRLICADPIDAGSFEGVRSCLKRVAVTWSD